MIALLIVDHSRKTFQQTSSGWGWSPVTGCRTSVAIGAASVTAKGGRGGLMTKLSANYPGYGWEHNCGYPTIDHRQALHALGVTPFHRQDFGTVKLLIARDQQMTLDLYAAELVTARS